MMNSRVELNDEMMKQVTGGDSIEEIIEEKNAIRRAYQAGQITYEEYIEQRDMNRERFKNRNN